MDEAEAKRTYELLEQMGELEEDSHRQNDFADVRAALQVAVRGGGLREREDAIHQHSHRMRFQQRPDVFAQFARDGALLGDWCAGAWWSLSR